MDKGSRCVSMRCTEGEFPCWELLAPQAWAISSGVLCSQPRFALSSGQSVRLLSSRSYSHGLDNIPQVFCVRSFHSFPSICAPKNAQPQRRWQHAHRCVSRSAEPRLRHLCLSHETQWRTVSTVSRGLIQAGDSDTIIVTMVPSVQHMSRLPRQVCLRTQSLRSQSSLTLHRRMSSARP